MNLKIKKNDAILFEALVTGRVNFPGFAILDLSTGSWTGFIVVAESGFPLPNDSVSIRTVLWHNSPPHREGRNTSSVVLATGVDADDYGEGSYTLAGAVAVAHAGHWDVLRWSLVFSTTSTLVFDSISKYELNLLAKHQGTLPSGATVLASSASPKLGKYSVASAIQDLKRSIRQPDPRASTSRVISSVNLAARLVDARGRTLGYSTTDGRLLSLASLVREVRRQGPGTDLEIVRHRGREYLRMSANSDAADNLSALPRLRVARTDLE